MQKLSVIITDSLSPVLEDFFCEQEGCNWSIEKINDKTPPTLFGYFDDDAQAVAAYSALRLAFPELSENFSTEKINDCDWQSEYKKYLTAWQCEDLHWVPVWMRGQYDVPAGDKVFYFDAGLAFGTGDHPTTRLCVTGMLKYLKNNGGGADKILIDAGCGSGILALSAKLEGFGKIFGFDRDPEAVRVSVENAALNNIALDGVEFEHAGIQKALCSRRADILLANIQADVLCIYADDFIAAVRDGGTLILSGILRTENQNVKEFFEQKCGARLENCEAFFMGDWSSLEIKFK